MSYQQIFKRYEIKYLLTMQEKEFILETMKPYMQLDKYGHSTIRNVYFDTDTFRLIRRSLEKPVYKEKLRVRSYKAAKEDDNVFVDGILVVNKTYALPADYNPGVNSEAQAAFDRMQADAAAEGLNIYISSGFRSYDYQAGLYQRYVDKDGKAEADRYSARAGHSEHQTGLAFDLNSIEESFANTKEGKWVNQNCHKYGFIIRYPSDKEDITGYKWEPWHIRYLGGDTAQAVYDSGLCLEEYLGITSKYAD